MTDMASWSLVTAESYFWKIGGSASKAITHCSSCYLFYDSTVSRLPRLNCQSTVRLSLIQLYVCMVDKHIFNLGGNLILSMICRKKKLDVKSRNFIKSTANCVFSPDLFKYLFSCEPVSSRFSCDHRWTLIPLN